MEEMKHTGDLLYSTRYSSYRMGHLGTDYRLDKQVIDITSNVTHRRGTLTLLLTKSPD